MTFLVGQQGTGWTLAGINNASTSTNAFYFFNGYVATTSGTATGFHVTQQVSGTATKCRGYVFAGAGVGATLLATSAEINPLATGDNSSAISCSITAGQTYTLAIQCPSGSFQQAINSGSSNFQDNQNTAAHWTYGTPPSTIPASDSTVGHEFIVWLDGTAGPSILTADTGTFTLVGEGTTLSSSAGAFSLPAATGSFSFTGVAATLTIVADFLLVCNPGTFDIVGGLGTSDIVLDAAADINSQFSLTSFPVVLTGPSGTAFALSVDSGLFSLSGPSVGLTNSVQFTLISNTGLYNLSGGDITGTLAGGLCNIIPQPGIVIVLELITEAFQKIGVVSELEFPTAEQGSNGLRILNDYLLNQAADGMRLGWFKQTDLAAIAPLRQEDVWGVKLLLARQLAAHYGIAIQDPVLMANMADAERMLTKRSLQYFESDLSELSRPEGGPYGGPGQWW